jgi:hypothetical protein
MDPIEKLKHEAWTELRIVRACATCRHMRQGWFHRICGATERLCSYERSYHSNACGQKGNLWEPPQPVPPSFWKSLRDAILARIESDKPKP